ncbi:MAG: 3-isopropylmalate dehydratase small subunit, partial [Clostridia bacterium]
PARYLNTFDSKNLALHCMEDIDKNFSKTVCVGDIIVGGENFGSGSSREHAPLAIKASGVSIIIAKSFARIFYRNCINIGLLVIENSELADKLSNNDMLSINLDNFTLFNITSNCSYSLPALPDFAKKIFMCGGLINAVKGGLL